MTSIAISGVTSYTGMCIAEACAARGHEVHGLARGPLSAYSRLKRQRLQRTEGAGVRLVGELPAEHAALLDWLGLRRLDVWIHHHHPMERFRFPDYDVTAASAAALAPLEPLVAALAGAGVRLVIYSGTYFEPGEGGQAPDAQATPYARLKAQVSNRLEQLCTARGIRFTKIVIPAPSGALENVDRLTPQVLHAAASGQPFALRSPEAVIDVIPGEALGGVYADAVERAEPQVLRPSGRVLTALAWVSQVRVDILGRLGHAHALALQVPELAARPAPVSFHNPPEQVVPVDWEAFAEAYAREWRASQPLR